jgi:hypothetical protein
MTKVVVRVVVTRGDPTPYEISHPRLAGLVKPPEVAHEASSSDAGSIVKTERSEIATGQVVMAATERATTGVAGTGEAHEGSERSASAIGASASPQDKSITGSDTPTQTGETGGPPTVEPVPPPKVADPLQRPGPISLFVSRKEGKLFVRKGFAPVFDTPITIAHPETPLGTHVFTAIRPTNDGSAPRWLAVSLGHDRAAGGQGGSKRKGRTSRDERPAPSTAESLRQAAVQALDRIELPPEALERIIPLVTPGASLLISDQGLGWETGRDTDFIVVTK